MRVLYNTIGFNTFPQVSCRSALFQLLLKRTLFALRTRNHIPRPTRALSFVPGKHIMITKQDMKCPCKPFFLVTAPKLNYFGTFQRVGCMQVVCMWPRHPVVNAFIYFSPSCFLSANDESALTLRRHLRPAVPLSLSLLRHQHAVVAVCTVRFALLSKTSHLAQTASVLTSIQLKQIWTRALTHIYARLAEFRRFPGLEVLRSVLWSCVTSLLEQQER